MHSIAHDNAFIRQSPWPFHENYLSNSGIVMKCPARDPYEEFSDDESDQHRWYRDHWGAAAITGIKPAREWPRDPVELDHYEDEDDDNAWMSKIAADEHLYAIKNQQVKRAKRNRMRLAEVRQRGLHRNHERSGYDQDFAHNVVEFLPRKEKPRVVH